MLPFEQLNLPVFEFRLRRRGELTQVWDQLRGGWLVLTPEEWVRQNFIRYMVEDLGVVAQYIRQELPVVLGGTRQRADIVVYDKNTQPLVVVECKAPEIDLSEQVWAQAVRYNSVIRAPYLIITNGLRHVCQQRDPLSGRYARCLSFPDLSVFFRV